VNPHDRPAASASISNATVILRGGAERLVKIKVPAFTTTRSLLRQWCRMRRTPPTKTLFACRQCSAVYAANQECYAGLGSFDCWDCNAEIFAWTENYHYSNWDQIDATSDIDWESCKNITCGASREPAG
jgi:hypothetical protein